ncbi:uncharacterized protein LOC111882929 [Lactuca sativa]|uniref:uncharacterized protein LOC111882929 n=1 Tax=Lactuca sativa TaxID=4236 RepID=UPI000CB27394|nr:uncharacterized protein LOC111882929 [Lactuca sativa]
MDEQIFMKFAIRYGPEKLKGKYHRMRSVHTKFSELINHTGVTWDAASGKVFANDTVWDDYFKRDKVFKTFKKKGCKIYPLLSLVFSGSTTSGAFHNASTCAPQTSEEERRIKDEYLDVGSVGESAFDGSNRKGKRKTERDIKGLPVTRREKKSNGNSKYDILLDAWSDSMIARKERDLPKAERYKSKYGHTTSLFVEEYSVGDCMATLEATQGVSSRSYNKALSFFPDINWRKMFLMMFENRRKDWLDSLDE